ncbi:MAG: ATP-binding cassette domain-containing protein, partial [Alphaproteobacteria bacterium]
MSNSILMEASGLRAGYGRIPVLHGIDLTVSDGEIVGVLGHNGMGKTTLLKSLIGLVPSTAGRIQFDGLDITREPTFERSRLGIGYVPQGRGIFPQLSVLDNLRMGVAAHMEDEQVAVDRVIVDFPRLENLLDRSGGTLSGGEQQLL